jgi:hypothetical protein
MQKRPVQDRPRGQERQALEESMTFEWDRQEGPKVGTCVNVLNGVNQGVNT